MISFTFKACVRRNVRNLTNQAPSKYAGRVTTPPVMQQPLKATGAMDFHTRSAINYGAASAAASVRKYAQKPAHENVSDNIGKKAKLVHCWHCARPTSLKDNMLCSKCGHLQDVDQTINYFELLNFPCKFQIETQALTQRFRQLQAIVHPDKYSNKTEREQTNSAEWSSLINKAYKTLLTPIERGQYLLQLNGHTLPEENTVLDKEFLMEMMDRNEEVEDATNANELKQLDNRINDDLNEVITQLSAAFDESCDMQEAIGVLIKMKYLISVQENIKTKLQSTMDTIA